MVKYWCALVACIYLLKVHLSQDQAEEAYKSCFESQAEAFGENWTSAVKEKVRDLSPLRVCMGMAERERLE